MNNPIDFFKSLFKNKKTTLTGREAIALQYLHPEKGAINTGDYCTTQDIANLSPPYTPPIGLTKQYDLRTSGFDEISNDTGVAIINGTSGPGPYYIYLPSSPYEGMEFYMCSNVSTAYGVSTPSYDAIISYTNLTNPTNLITVNQLETLNFKYTGGIWVVSKIQNYTITSDTVVTDEITEKNAGVGVTIDGVLLKDGKVQPLYPKVYKAILTQSGTNAPVARVLNGNDANYLGDLTWSWVSTGQFNGSKAGITDTNTLVTISGYDSYTNCVASSNAVIILRTETSSGNPALTNELAYLYITVEYYGA